MTRKHKTNYVVHAVAAEGKLLLGGVRESRSSVFEELRDALTRAETVREFNPDAAIVVEPTTVRAEIYRHCSASAPQAIGGKCFVCGVTLRGRERDEEQERES